MRSRILDSIPTIRDSLLIDNAQKTKRIAYEQHVGFSHTKGIAAIIMWYSSFYIPHSDIAPMGQMIRSHFTGGDNSGVRQSTDGWMMHCMLTFNWYHWEKWSTTLSSIVWLFFSGLFLSCFHTPWECATSMYAGKCLQLIDISKSRNPMFLKIPSIQDSSTSILPHDSYYKLKKLQQLFCPREPDLGTLWEMSSSASAIPQSAYRVSTRWNLPIVC